MAPLDTTIMAAEPGDVSDRTIVRQATVDLPIREVWRLWTTEDGVTEWLVSSAAVQLQIGGAYEFNFAPEAPEGSRGGEGCRVLSYLPERMLSFTWNAPPSYPEERGKRTWVVIELNESGTGETHVRLTHLGWPESGWHDGGKWPEVFAYFESAWKHVLAALVLHAKCG